MEQEEKVPVEEKLKQYRGALISSMELNVLYSRNKYRLWLAVAMIWSAFAAFPPYTLLTLIYLFGSIINVIYAKSEHSDYVKFHHHLNIMKEVANQS
jgi:hypothetical protein